MSLVDQEGSFKAKVVSKDYCRAKSGAEQLAVRFEVVDGPQAGHQITEFLSFSEAALKYTVEKMRTMGWSGIDLADVETLGSNEVEIVVRAEEWEGQSRMRVAFINAVGGASMALKSALNESERKAFAARMRGLIVGLDPSQARKPAAPPQREEPPPPSDEDLAF